MVMLTSPSWDAWFTPCVEVGWRFAKDQWGHGFAPEAAHAVVDWAFANQELPDDSSSASPRCRTRRRGG